VTLTVGTGPFGHEPAGRFNFEVPARGVEYLEPLPRRIRAVVGREVVIDTVGAQMLHVQHHLPVWCFPPADVRLDVLGAGAWVHDGGLAHGLVGVRWDAVEKWLEEDEEVIVHPRDPYHRIELRDTSRRVEVALGGTTLAASSAPLVLFETTLPARWYFAREDVAAELVLNPAVRTGCAYKGWATYFDVRLGDEIERALAWQYTDPLPGMERIRGRVCFFNERVDVIVDGAREDRPQNRWSTTDWLDEASVDEQRADGPAAESHRR
jgi:uncharacterized protein (DUF427 family)